MPQSPAATPADVDAFELDRGYAPQVKIRLRGLVKRFGDLTVLDGIDLDVHERESLVLVGASGTGKSVLLKHLIGLLRPDAGTVEVDGIDINTLDYKEIAPFRRRFGMAFQEGALFDSMTVAENVGFPLRRNTRLGKSEIAERVDECLALVRLDGVGRKLPSELSGGMRRRVGLARAIALRPQILLLDEPTTGLDPVMSSAIDELIVDLERTLQTTTVTITHDMTSAFRIGDRIGMLHEGHLIALASPEQFKDLDDPRVRQFLEREAHGPLTDGARRKQAGEQRPATAE
jgi:phospholipid/cholesterol/gamma-HCH transport system ATP-binding protein